MSLKVKIFVYQRAVAMLFIVLCGGFITNLAHAQGSGDQQTIEELVIVGTQDSGVVSVGRNSLDASEQSRSIQIFEEDFLQLLKPANIEDVLILSSNVVFSGTSDGRENSFSVRGFDSAPILRDGFRVTSFGGITDPEIFNLERAEVLKGPDSIVYGEANPGGIINLVTKRPLTQDLTVFSLEVGENPSYSPRFDINRAMGNVAFRVVGLYDYNEDFRDYDEANKRTSLVPSLRWEPRDGTVVTFLGEYVDEDNQADFGTAVDNDAELTADVSQVINHPVDRLERQFFMTGIDVEHALNERFTLEARVRHFDTRYEYSTLLLPLDYDPQTNTVFRVGAQQEQDTEEWAAQVNLFGEFHLGEMRNRFTLGADWRDTDQVGATLFDPTTPYFLDWANPDYSQLPPTPDQLPQFPPFATDAKRMGLFLQNHLNVTENFMVSLGIRRDDTEANDDDYAETIMQAGVIYHFNEDVAVFANYSESFNPQSSRDRFNELLDPEIGEGIEIGVKGRLLGGRLSYTAAFFDITKENVAITDPDFPFASIAAEEQMAQGFEIDLVGRVTDKLSLVGSIGMVDTEDENDENISNSADFTSTLFATYRFNERWDASLGYEHVGERKTGTLEIDPHTVVNVALGFTEGPWRAQLNISNLLDEEYLDSTFGSLGRGNHPGAPIQTLLTVTYTGE